MALAQRAATFALIAVAVPGTSTIPSTGLPDNCTGVNIKNIGLFPLLWGIGAPGLVLVVGTNAGSIAVGASLSLTFGDVSRRGIMAESALAGSGLIFDAVGGVGAGEIIYLNGLG